MKSDQPPWDTIQTQAKDYVQSALDMAKYDPPKGSKESWTKLAGEFASAASELDKAAQAKDKDAATAAHKTLERSCMACHREHRIMGPGMGGGMRGGPGGMRGGFPGGPGGPGGPPPGGPGGPPPGGEAPK